MPSPILMTLRTIRSISIKSFSLQGILWLFFSPISLFPFNPFQCKFGAKTRYPQKFSGQPTKGGGVTPIKGVLSPPGSFLCSVLWVFRKSAKTNELNITTLLIGLKTPRVGFAGRFSAKTSKYVCVKIPSPLTY